MSRSINNKCIRISVPDAANSIILPLDISNVEITNVGAWPVKINFDDDDASDYVTIDPGKVKIFGVQGGVTLHTDGIGGASILEVLSW